MKFNFSKKPSAPAPQPTEAQRASQQPPHHWPPPSAERNQRPMLE